MGGRSEESKNEGVNKILVSYDKDIVGKHSKGHLGQQLVFCI